MKSAPLIEGSSETEHIRPGSGEDGQTRTDGLRIAIGLGMALALVWGGLIWRVLSAEAEALAHASRLASNLSLALEENILRTVSNIDQSILNVRLNYERSQGRAFNAEAEFGLAQAMHALALHVSIIGEDGVVAQTSRGQMPDRIDLGEEDYFRIHKSRDFDQLFIGRPGADPVSKRDAMQFTRRLRRPDGGFGGVLAMSVDPLLMSEFYKTVDLGQHGVISVIGRDGILRAGSQFSEAKSAGPAFSAALLARAAQSPAGHFVEDAAGGHGRLAVSFRGLMDYPLIVAVGVPVEGLAAILGGTMAADLAAGFLLSLLLGAAAWRFDAQSSRYEKDHLTGREEFSRLAAAVECLPQGIALIGPGGKVVSANQQWRVLSRRLAALAVLDNDPECGPSQEGGPSRQDVLDILAGLSPGLSCDFAEEAAGRDVWHRLEIAPLPALAGGAVMQLIDITEKHKLENEVQSAHALTEFFEQSASEWFWETSADFRTIWLSANFEAMTSLSPQDFLGQHVDALLIDLDPGILAQTLDDMQACREFSGVELSARAAKGAIRQFSMSGQPKMDPQGVFTGYRGRATDTSVARNADSERLAYQARLAEAERHYKSLLETAALAVAILDENGSLIECSPSLLEILDQPPEAVIGGTLADWSPDHLKTVTRERISSLRETAGSFEMTLIRADGCAFDVLVSGRRVTEGGATRIYATLEDLTALRQMEAALQAARDKVDAVSKAMMSFLKEVGRELHTQIYSIIDISHRTLATYEPKTGQGGMAAIEKTAKRLLAVTGGIMDCADLANGNLALASERFDLERLIDEILALVDDMAEAKGVELVVQIAPKTPRQVIGDPRRLGRALLNCALQAATLAESGEIVVRVEPAQGGSEKTVLRFSFDFSVPDGPQDAWFAAIQASSETEGWTAIDIKKGAGIGGAVLRPLINLLGGEAGIASNPDGRRSIWLIVPLKPARAREPKAPAGIGGRRMLVVDDSRAAREALAAMLQEFGVNAEQAASGREALESITATMSAERQFEAVFIDQDIKDIDSFEAISRIRGKFAEGKFPNLILMSSGHAPEFEAPHLVKPVMRYRLGEILTRVLGIAEPRKKSSSAKSGQSADDPSNLRGTRILLVDDSPTGQLVARDMLEAVGMNVDIAGNGQAAVDMVLANDYEMVLMDLRMPVLSGIEAARRIRMADRFARLPIIAMTDEDWKDEQEKLIQFGLNDAIVKPVDPDQLYAVIHKWVAGPEATFSRLH
jgi:PAS domain S-box-containing protein